jgi:ABC-type branched-subunit amino acid transport system substrate-binding protein
MNNSKLKTQNSTHKTQVMFPLAFCIALLLASCGRPVPTYKIALVAPFEGRLRQVGYDTFPAMRLAIRDQINAGGVGGAFVTFIAYNDSADPAMAERVARNVALDPEVLAVMGHLTLSTTLAAMDVYTNAGLPMLTLLVPADQVPASPLVFNMSPAQGSRNKVQSSNTQVKSATCNDLRTLTLEPSLFAACTFPAPPVSDLPQAQDALKAFTDLSLGPLPSPRSIVAFDATNVLLEAIRRDAQAHGTPTRAGVAAALREIQHAGLLGTISFNEQGAWQNAPLWVYPP